MKEGCPQEFVIRIEKDLSNKEDRGQNLIMEGDAAGGRKVDRKIMKNGERLSVWPRHLALRQSHLEGFEKT